MRLHILYLSLVIVLSCANSGFAQTAPLIGGVSVVPGQGATLSVTVPILSGNPLRFWTNSGPPMPLGVTMTPTYLEPGTNRLSLHFEAAALAHPVSNRLIYLYAGTSLSPAYRVLLSVVSGIRQPCGAPVLNPLDQSSQAVIVSSGLTQSCTAEVWAGDDGGLEPIANATIGAGISKLQVPIPRRLSPGQIVRVLQRSRSTVTGPATTSVTTFLSAPVIVENNFVTYRYDSERSGWNPNETSLTVDSVQFLAMICDQKKVDGEIRAQPLYVQDVLTPTDGKKHNLVFAATGADSVWAFDADTCVPNDQGLWRRGLIDTNNGERALTAHDVACPATLGTTATPVVDRTTNTMYVLTRVVKNGNVIYKLHALDITTGADQPASPVEITSATLNFGTLSFDPVSHVGRPGLLLDRGVVYIAFGSQCDIGTFHGWVAAYDATIPRPTGFLSQLGVFNTSPSQTNGGIWQSGMGLAADGSGTIYLATGNGPFDPTKGVYANTVLSLKLSKQPNTKNMEVANFFTPWDWATTYGDDCDLGVGGPVLLSPHDQGPFSVAGVSKHFILVGGKEPKSYLIDRDLLDSGVNTGNPNRCIAATGQGCTADDPNLVACIPQTTGICGPTPPQACEADGSMAAGPAYYTGPRGTRIFYGFNFVSMSAYNFQWLPPLMTPAEQTSDAAPETAPIPAVSSNRDRMGTGVLWAVVPAPIATQPQTLALHAYDAEHLGTNLLARRPGNVSQTGLDAGTWSSTLAAGNSFETPTVIHGKVFTGSDNRLFIFAPVNCIPRIIFNAVIWFCHWPVPELVLQRLSGQEWISLSGQAAFDRDSSYLFDYPPAETTTYRICVKDLPKSCLPEVSVTIDRAQSRIPDNLKDKCGVPGKLPCFHRGPWPTQAINRPRDR